MVNNDSELLQAIKELTHELKVFNSGFKLLIAGAITRSNRTETFNKADAEPPIQKTKSFNDVIIATDKIETNLKRVVFDEQK